MVTMTDPQCVNTYVNELRFNVFWLWKSQTPAQRGAAMHQAVTRVHKMCGVPETTFRVAAIGLNHGLFQFSRWEIEMNTSLFSDFVVDVNNIHEYFVYIAELLYHEARHCEQCWYIARYLASNARSSSFLASATQSPVFKILKSGSPFLTQEGAAYMVKKLGIPTNIAMKSLDHPMKGQDPMRQLTEGWYKSIYGESNRRAVLGALSLNRRNVPGEQPILLQKFRENIQQKYSGGLPEEKDAWGIQELIRQAFRRYQRA